MTASTSSESSGRCQSPRPEGDATIPGTSEQRRTEEQRALAAAVELVKDCRERHTPLAIDLFSGAGGATQGLRDAGYMVVGAVEFDATAAKTYRQNHEQVYLWERDITTVAATAVRDSLSLQQGELALLKACPPCQGFSSLAQGRVQGEDPRNELVRHTIRFVRALRPHAVLLENVPGLGQDRRARELGESLTALGYSHRIYIVDAADFGVPQHRRRMIMLALRGLRSRLPETIVPAEVKRKSVRTAFQELADHAIPDDPLNVPRVLTGRVLERVQAIPEEGNRYALVDDMELPCHRKLRQQKRSGAASPYGRLRWDQPAPTMTTRCTTPSCGAFLHPKENRPITLREAACLQTFPAAYQFAGTRGEIERQIGNAVPVGMAQQIALHVLGCAPRRLETT